jgi:hypothetical protein
MPQRPVPSWPGGDVLIVDLDRHTTSRTFAPWRRYRRHRTTDRMATRAAFPGGDLWDGRVLPPDTRGWWWPPSLRMSDTGRLSDRILQVFL